MSVKHYRPPVTETLPPFVFQMSRCACHDSGYTVELWKDEHYLTVQFPAPTEQFEDEYDYIDAEVIELQRYANSLVFGRTNWAYFIRKPDGKRALAYRQRPKRRVNYPPFAPIAHESEFRSVRPISGGLVEGIWRGKQVDAWLALNDDSCAFLEKQMRGYDLLRSLDVTFEVLAHLADSDGNITGIIMEPAFGRPFQAADIMALNDAMCRLHDRGVHFSVNPDFTMMSHDHKVRFLYCSWARKFRDPEERERERLNLQRALHKIYLDYKGVYHPDASHRYRHVGAYALDGVPSLEFPVGIFTMAQALKKLEALTLNSNPNAPLSVHRICYRGNGTSALPLAETTRIEETEEPCDVTDDNDDRPLLRPRRRREKKHKSQSGRPYDTSGRKSRKLLLAPE